MTKKMKVDFSAYLDPNRVVKNVVQLDQSKYKKTKSEKVSFDDYVDRVHTESDVVVTETVYDPNIYKVDITDAEAVFYAALYGGPLY